MKFYLKKTLSVLVAAVLLATTLFAGVTVSADSNVVARYLVTSDVHNLNSDLSDAIEVTYEYAQTQTYKGFDAILIAGDMTNKGTVKEYDDFFAAVNVTLDSLFDEGNEPKLIASMGNHDYGNKTNTDEVNAEYRARFEEYFGYAPSYTHDINGVKFINISMSSHVNKNLDFDWLEQQLAAAVAENPDAVINVVTHIPIVNTVFGSEKEHGNGIEYPNNRLDEILSNYPNAILWTGHSHAYIGSEKSLYQDEAGGYSAINTGSFSTAGAYYTSADQIIGTVNSEQLKNFYIVETYANDTSRVRRYDLKNDQFFANDWLIGAGYDNTLAGRLAATEAPYFPEGSAITIGGGVKGMMLSVPDAMDDEGVELYKVTVTDGETTTTTKVMRHYYYTVVDPIQLLSVKDLAPNTEYTATVTAVDFFGKESEPLTTTFTTGDYVEGLDTLYEGAIDASEWTGSTNRISDGIFGADHSSSIHAITLANNIDLGNKFEIAVDFVRNETNLSDACYSLIQMGELSFAMRRTGASNTLALCYGFSGSNLSFDGDYVIKQVNAPSTNVKEEYRILFDNGNITVYRSGAVVLYVSAEEFAEFIGGEYDFSKTAISLKLAEKWIITVNSARFETFTLKTNIPQSASYTFADMPFDTENWTIIGTAGSVNADSKFVISSGSTSTAIKANETMNLGNNFTANFTHNRGQINADAAEFSFAQIGDIGIMLQNRYDEDTAYVSLCHGYNAIANSKTAPSAEEILAKSANLGSPESAHNYSIDFNNGQIKVYRDGLVVLTYDATALNLDFSNTQVAFQLNETWVSSSVVYFSNFYVTRSFTIDELNTAIAGLVVDGKLVASEEEVYTANAMYNALSSYQLPLVEDAETLTLANKLLTKVIGDVNGDKLITSTDYNALRLSLLGYNNEYEADALDVDQSGEVNSADSLALLQHMLGIATLG